MRGWALRVDDDKFLLEENRSRGAAVIPFGAFSLFCFGIRWRGYLSEIACGGSLMSGREVLQGRQREGQ